MARDEWGNLLPPEYDLSLSESETRPDSDRGEAPSKSSRPTGPSQATELVDLARVNFDVLRGADSKIYAVARDNPGVAFALRGDGGLKQQLAKAFYDLKGRTPSGSAGADALAVLEGDAKNADTLPVHIRVGSAEGAVILDLGEPTSRAVRVSSNGWSIVPTSPVLFRRTPLTLAMTPPVRGGSLDALRALINADERGFRLLVAWMLGAFLADSPQPILALMGQQGTAKTTAAGIILSFVDPSPAALRSIPRTEEEWAVSSFNTYGVGLDNVSRLAPWFQDALCRAVTGAALIRRERYSDDAVSALYIKRPIVLTTIDAGALQGDVADRLLLVELAPIDRTQRRTDAEITSAVDAIRAETLGALLDLLVEVLRVLPSIHLEEKPRMADFALILAALDRVTGWGTLDDFLAAADAVGHDVVEGDLFAMAIVELATQRGTWQGTSADLLGVLGEHPQGARWPNSPTKVSSALRRMTPALAQVGVTVQTLARSNRGTVYAIATADTSQSCTVCGERLADALINSNQRTHPMCDTDEGDEQA